MKGELESTYTMIHAEYAMSIRGAVDEGEVDLVFRFRWDGTLLMMENTHPCEFCDTHQPQTKKHVTVTRHRGGQWFIFEDVPIWVCPNCGHRYFDADVLESMEKHMTSTPAGARQVTAWAMSLSEKAG